jgi:3-isopropylmalate dehydrogenase
MRFCRKVFADGGAILAGPGGGRFVYEMRRKFDLFVKMNPILPFPELEEAGPVKLQSRFSSDLIIVRENRSGLYQGSERLSGAGEKRRVAHRFAYSERDVTSLLAAAAELASRRSGRLTVVTKESGLPELSGFWLRCAEDVAAATGIRIARMDIDFAVYQLVAKPDDFDVIAVSNCFGDILSDLGGLLMGARGITYGASYSPEGWAVYQTNHGAAYDLAGQDKANPVGQIFSLAMMLRETFGLAAEASAIVRAVRQSWREGWRTADLMASGCRLAGTAAMGRIVAENIVKPMAMGESIENFAPAH